MNIKLSLQLHEIMNFIFYGNNQINQQEGGTNYTL